MRTALTIPAVSPGLGAEGTEGVVELKTLLDIAEPELGAAKVKSTWRQGRKSSPLALTHL